MAPIDLLPHNLLPDKIFDFYTPLYEHSNEPVPPFLSVNVDKPLHSWCLFTFYETQNLKKKPFSHFNFTEIENFFYSEKNYHQLQFDFMCQTFRLKIF